MQSAVQVEAMNDRQRHEVEEGFVLGIALGIWILISFVLLMALWP